MALAARNVSTQSMPPGCQAKCVTYVSPLSAAPTDELDLRQFILNGFINAVQSIFVDNSQNSGGSVRITMQGTNQTISCPASSQGWFPALVVPGDEVFEISCPLATSDVPLYFVNIPMPTNVWTA